MKVPGIKYIAPLTLAAGLQAVPQVRAFEGQAIDTISNTIELWREGSRAPVKAAEGDVEYFKNKATALIEEMEENGKWSSAVEAWEKLGNKSRENEARRQYATELSSKNYNYQAGIQYEAAGDTDLAKASWEKALEKGNNSPELRAKIYELLGRSEESKRHYREAAEENASKGQFKAAKEYFEKASVSPEEYAEIIIEDAINNGQFEQAVTSLQSIKDPEKLEKFALTIATANFNDKQARNSELILDLLKKSGKTDQESVNFLADLYKKSGDLESAAYYYDQTGKAQTLVRTEMGEYLEEKHPEQAAEWYKRGGQNKKANALYISVARKHEERKDFSEAAKLYETGRDNVSARRCYIEEAKLHEERSPVYAAKLYMEAGEKDKAEKLYIQEAEKLANNNQFAAAADLYAAANKMKVAKDLYLKAAKIAFEEEKYSEVLGFYTQSGLSDFQAKLKVATELESYGKLQAAIHYYEAAGNERKVASLYETLGGIHESEKSFSTAEYCYRRSGNTEKEKAVIEMLIREEFEKKEFTSAAKRMVSIGIPIDTANRQCAQAAQSHGILWQALQLYEEIKDEQNVKVVRGQMIEREIILQNFNSAGTHAEKLGNQPLANSFYTKAAEKYEAEERFADAGKMYEKAGMEIKALDCYKKYVEKGVMDDQRYIEEGIQDLQKDSRLLTDEKLHQFFTDAYLKNGKPRAAISHLQALQDKERILSAEIAIFLEDLEETRKRDTNNYYRENTIDDLVRIVTLLEEKNS